MLLLVEHDHVMRTPRARQLLTQLLTLLARGQGAVVLFRSARRGVADLLRSYPQGLRERIVVTPPTPRGTDLAFWLHYEVCCTLAALRNAAVLGREERWLVIASRQWTDALSRHVNPEHLLPVTGELDRDQIEDLRNLLRQRRPLSLDSAMRASSVTAKDSRPATARPFATSVLRRRPGRGGGKAARYRRGTHATT
jgi:hypothetical protein